MKWVLIMIALLVISASTVAMVSESRQSLVKGRQL